MPLPRADGSCNRNCAITLPISSSNDHAHHDLPTEGCDPGISLTLRRTFNVQRFLVPAFLIWGGSETRPHHGRGRDEDNDE